MFSILCPSCGVNQKLQDTQQLSSCSSCHNSITIENIETYLPKLLVVQGADKGEEFSIRENTSIGRANQNTIRLKEIKASRQHASIFFKNTSYYIKDLQSGNGTLVNGNPVSLLELKDKDIIRIGDAMILFRNDHEYIPDSANKERSHTVIGTKKIEAVLGLPSKFEHHTKAELNYNRQHSFMMSSKDFQSSLDVEKVNEKLRIIYEVSNAIGSILPLEEVLSVILETVFRYIPAQRGAILLHEKEGCPLKIAVAKVASEKEKETTIHISNTLMDRVVKEQKSILTLDTMLDENLKTAASVMGKIRSAMSVPLISKSNLLGVLHVDTSKKSSSFNEDTLELLTGIAGQAAIAIENAKLIKDIERETETRGHLQRYLSPDLVDQVVNKKIDLDMGGQVKKATILFTDLRGFTSMTENIGAEAVVTILNDYFTRMVDIIFARKGTLDKFMGDAIMATWGLPILSNKDSALAIQAALEMQNELFYFNMSQRKVGKNTLKIGAGINTGEVVVGNMGSPKRMEYTVIGPDVNLASRIEHLTSKNQVLISENTYNETKDLIMSVGLDAVKLKGIKRLLPIYAVVGISINGANISFLPILFNGELEGLVKSFTKNEFVLHIEPFKGIEEKKELKFCIDVKKIAPDESITLKIDSFTHEKHNDKDEYVEIKGRIITMPDKIKQFFVDVFGVAV